MELSHSRTTIIAHNTIYNCRETQKERKGCSSKPLTLFEGFRAVLHPIHVIVFTAYFIKPPTEGVAIWMVRVCSPDTVDGHRQLQV